MEVNSIVFKTKWGEFRLVLIELPKVSGSLRAAIGFDKRLPSGQFERAHTFTVTNLAATANVIRYEAENGAYTIDSSDLTDYIDLLAVLVEGSSNMRKPMAELVRQAKKSGGRVSDLAIYRAQQALDHSGK